MKIRPESLAVTKLELFFHDVSLGIATGFIYKYGQSITLVSNWHVFSGINPITGVQRDSRYCPNRVKFNINLFNSRDGSILFRGEDAELVVDGQNLWREHRGYVDKTGKAKPVDTGVLVLNDRIPDFESIKDKIMSFGAHVLVNMDANDQPSSIEHGYPRIASEVFILGYPKGLSVQGVLPIWKRGSVASEPLFSVMDEVPAIFVDAVTRDGMSGSETFALAQSGASS